MVTTSDLGPGCGAGADLEVALLGTEVVPGRRDRSGRLGLGVGLGLGLGLGVGEGAGGAGGRALAVARALLARGYIVLTGGARGDALTLSPPLDIDAELLTGFAGALGDTLRALS